MKNRLQATQTLWGSFTKHTVVLFATIFFIIVILHSTTVLSYKNLFYLITRDPYIYLLAAGITPVIMCGCIDMSLIGQISLYTVIVGYLSAADIPLPVTLLMLLGAATVCAGINVGMQNLLKAPTFVVTLATQLLFKGIATAMLPGNASLQSLPYEFRMAIRAPVLGTHVDVLLGIAAVLFTAFVMTHTYVGLCIKSIGANELVASKAGVKVNNVKFSAYLYCSILTAIAAIVCNARLGAQSVVNISGIDLVAIVAVYMSGLAYTRLTSINMFGFALRISLAIALIELIENGMIFFGLPSDLRVTIEAVMFLAGLGLSVSDELAAHKL